MSLPCPFTNNSGQTFLMFILDKSILVMTTTNIIHFHTKYSITKHVKDITFASFLTIIYAFNTVACCHGFNM